MAAESLSVVILGAAGTGLMMAETIRRADGFTFAGFLDDDPAKQADGRGGHKVLGPLNSWSELPDDYGFLSSLYGPKCNAEFCETIERLAIPAARWATVVDPTAVVSPDATLARGVFVGPLCVVEPQAQLGSQSVLLGSVHLAHHVQLDDYVACANRVSLAGGVQIGRAAFVGATACVREYVRVGDRAVIGMGSVVLDDVAPGQTVAGNPARALIV
jgi:sugar O-acyltransferase (sialic acid O-acetyltransferase NeuD family)